MELANLIALFGIAVVIVGMIIAGAVANQKSADRSQANTDSINDIYRRKAEMRAHIERIAEEISDFKEYVAEHYAPLPQLDKMESRIMKALDDIANRLDRQKEK